MRCKICCGIIVVAAAAGGGGGGRIATAAALFLLRRSGGGGGEYHDGQTAEKDIALPLAFLGGGGEEMQLVLPLLREHASQHDAMMI